jgi:hypothetical protein
MIEQIYQICNKEGLKLKSITFFRDESLIFRGTCDDEGNIKINILIPYVDEHKQGNYCNVKKEHQESYGLVCNNDIMFEDILDCSIKGGLSYRFDLEYFIDTIAHEIAHLRFKSHSQDHTKYTEYIKRKFYASENLLRLLKQSEFNSS